ncbi:LysR family transcriptional regulator [Celeribacter indicus]|uniref:LysR family transcriptional regulator n=2 Tax=Celeribacter indicus TaxID=1208324 RepID=A0A0B5E5C4_9RHOB|nr:LysR family transcriptional regulator [Celeribacter indicus]AJE47557.1 LysR family transcriptional regulator [Celeribacter indicus]SDW10120.1 transcriptional regulator, LysR family [Celeribacter indicus]
MDIKRLRFFIAVAELGSLSRAADALHISQPALGLHIRTLEEELDRQLFVRHSRGVEITQAGRQLLPHARRIVRDVEETVELLRPRKTPAGKVTVGVGPAIDPKKSAGLIERASARFPEIRLNLVTAPSATLVDWIAAGRLDLALVHLTGALPSGIGAEPVMQEDIVLVSARPDRDAAVTIPFGALARHPVVLPPAPHSLRAMVDAAAQGAGIGLNIRFEIETVDVMLELAEQGIAGCIVSRSALSAHPRPEAFLVQKIVEPDLVREVSLIRSTGRQPLPATDLVARLITDVYSG